MVPFVLLALADAPRHGYVLAGHLAHRVLRQLAVDGLVTAEWMLGEEHLHERAADLRRQAERIELFIDRYRELFAAQETVNAAAAPRATTPKTCGQCPRPDKETKMNPQNEAPTQDHAPQLSRREAVTAGGLLALGMAGAAGGPASASASSTTSGTAAARSTVRLASVTTVQDGGLLPRLLAPFEARTGRRVQVHIGEDVYAKARAGEADLVFSHLGHKDTQAFITEGLGQWPRTVLFNASALIMHASDPAGVAEVADPVAAFRRIADARAPFIGSAMPGLAYIADILWNAAGRPDKTGWYDGTGLGPEAAMRAAAQQRGYSLWGLTPFLVWQKSNPLPLRPALYGDEMFHRVMVSIVVNPARFPRANVAGALALQEYLLLPATQALIQNHRYPGLDQPVFWPAGRDNAAELLPAPAGTRAVPGTGGG
ncbi:hypothetical protein [Nonomuraea guangzhouensis]|uniref:Uncharacterized protein n=1 Tax=Nonomuraea guangzhouensis TaxID=1291555 RepID=A0ABW4FZL6_9ACTN|nr:hypothetical protein [Nonomuraea guangzhouensis]